MGGEDIELRNTYKHYNVTSTHAEFRHHLLLSNLITVSLKERLQITFCYTHGA